MLIKCGQSFLSHQLECAIVSFQFLLPKEEKIIFFYICFIRRATIKAAEIAMGKYDAIILKATRT